MKILVISSCTNSKLNRKARAAEPYTGLGHRYLMEGLDQARARYGRRTIDLAIVSAKYGLLSEDNIIEPYDCTFRGLKVGDIAERGKTLQLHDSTKVLISRYKLVFFLLGKEYVRALQLPFAVTRIFLLGAGLKNLIPDAGNVHFVPAGKGLATELGTTNTALKGLVFKRLCGVVSRQGLEIFERIKRHPERLIDFVVSPPRYH